MDNQINEIYELYNTIISQKKLLSEAPNLPVLKRMISPLEVEGKNWDISTKFGEQRSDGVHNAVDIRVPSGSKLMSPENGVIVEADKNIGECGGRIVIQHTNGFRSGFCHLRKIDVVKGQTVGKGDVIAETGGGPNDPNRGQSTGSHLHYQLSYNNTFVDPQKYTGSILDVISDDPIFENLDEEDKEKLLKKVKEFLAKAGKTVGVAAAIAGAFMLIRNFVKSKNSTTTPGGTQATTPSSTTQPPDLTAEYIGDIIAGLLPG